MIQAGRQGLREEDYTDLLKFETSERYTEREKVALRYTSDSDVGLADSMTES